MKQAFVYLMQTIFLSYQWLPTFSWSGVLESMQYFATVIPDCEEVRAEQIMWLGKDKIEDQVILLISKYYLGQMSENLSTCLMIPL